MSGVVRIPEIADTDTGEVHALSLRVELRPTCLVLPDDMTFEEWQAQWEWLQRAEHSLMWWIGDLLRFGEQRWGEMYEQAIEATGRSYATLRDAKWVADGFGDLSRRHDKLSWSHHREVAGQPPERADALLAEAQSEGWSKNELRAAVRRLKTVDALGLVHGETCTIADLHQAVADGRKFGSVYADPPWLYDNQATRASTGNHYSGMTVDELCELPVRALAADDAHLHLWTTNAFIFECPRIFDAWGFEFRSTFVWVKPQMGIGNYWRNSHEFLLTAIRGNAKRFNNKSLKSWLECDRAQHSSKPDMVRGFIEKASPGPYLELFGRSQHDGWAVWGNQISPSLFHPNAEAA